MENMRPSSRLRSKMSRSSSNNRSTTISFDEEMGKDVHTVFSEKCHERKWSMKIKRGRETERLFHDTCRTVKHVHVHGSFKFTRVKCRTKNASVIHLPVDYDEPVLFTQIRINKLDLKSLFRDRSTVWLAVMNKYYHEKSDYDIGDIIRVQNPNVARRVVDWFKRQTSDGDKPVCFDTCVYPRKRRVRTPMEDLQKNCRLCDPPSARCYKSLASAIEAGEPMPFILTIPFDPFTRSVHKGASSTASTSYFEKVVIDGTESFTVLIVTFNEDKNVIAVIIPERISFDVDSTITTAATTTIFHHDKNEDLVSEREFELMRRKLEPILMRLENQDDITQIDLELQADRHQRSSGDLGGGSGGDSGESDFISHEFEMQCIVKYKSQIKRNEARQSSFVAEDLPTSDHPYYNVVPEESESGCNDDEVDLVSFDESGNISISSSSGKKNNNDDYLMPLTEFTKEYSLFKSTVGKYTEKEHILPDNVVIGTDGYVQVQEEEKLRRKQEEAVAAKQQKKAKVGFWNRKKKYNMNDEKEEQKLLRDDPLPSPPDKFEYYQPMFNIFQEKPAVPPKKLSPEHWYINQKKKENNSDRKSCPEEEGKNVSSSSPVSPPPRLGSESRNSPAKAKPDIPKRSKSVLQYKHQSSSMKPLLESFDDDDEYEEAIALRKNNTKRSSVCSANLNSRVSYFESKFQ